MSQPTKSCLVISYGPVPTSQYQTVEGGGMRAWGLAQGLTANGIDVTVGINQSFPQELTEYEGIKLLTWSLDADFANLLNSFDTVVVSYCMGDPSIFIADNITDDIQLILDAYVPIYIEVSARDSKDVETEYANYMADIGRFNRVLQRGDFFLYANDAQELLYSGVLSALGVINPSSYRQKRLIKCPFGVHRTPAVPKTNPYKLLGVAKNDFIVLWFGGIYPWFRIEEYLEAILELSKDKKIRFVFVGGKNPFNPNPDFARQYELAVDFAKNHKLIDKQMHFIDWVDFQDRMDWYAYADVIVSLNQTGEENKYSWRTRVMDYIWGEAVIISNGGDPLSEELIANHAAIRLESLTAPNIIKAITDIKQEPAQLSFAKENVKKLKNNYYWDIVTVEPSKIIKSGDLPFNLELPLKRLVEPAQSLEGISNPIKLGRLAQAASIPRKVIGKVRQKGVMRTAKIAGSVIKTQAKARQQAKYILPQFIFISHPINNSGAPIVLLQIIEEYVHKYGAKRVRVIAPGIEKEQKTYLKRLGVQVEQAVFGISFRFIRLQLGLKRTDTVIINTAAIYDNYRDFILLWLRSKRLKHAYWFIHEDIAQLPYIHKEFLDPRNIAQVSELVKSNALTLLFPSKRTANEYKELLGIDRATAMNLHVEIPDKYIDLPRKKRDFDSLRFLLSGNADDGRKGQLIAISAFYKFYKEFYEKYPENYRSFKLNLVAVGTKTYVSQQIRWIGESLLGDAAVIYDSLPKERALDITSQSNVVVCCSLNETFGLYIAEGMLMGHVVLRNNSAGVDEQLRDGENGLLFDHTDLADFVSKIEVLLNKEKTSNAQLLAMSDCSRSIMREYSQVKYLPQLEASQPE